MGKRWVTHESDDARWEDFRQKHNLPLPRMPPMEVSPSVLDAKEPARDGNSSSHSIVDASPKEHDEDAENNEPNCDVVNANGNGSLTGGLSTNASSQQNGANAPKIRL